jgi:serine/threonine protein phosphatase PrpC
MPFTTASISNSGGRAANEDNAGYLEAAGAGCWVVADGLGGHGGGATASRLAVEAVLSSFRANPVVTANALLGHLAAAHDAILRQQNEPALSQMRSTVVVLLANDQAAVYGYIGDSRLYQFQAGSVEFQTVDHSVPGALAAGGSIAYDQIRFHEDRNRVLRSLGNEGKVNPVIGEVSLCQSDMFLLCTDGFWEYVTEFEMEADLAKASAPADWLRFMVSRLLGRAKTEHDNYTATAIFFRSQTAPLPQARRRRSGGTRQNRSGLTERLSWLAIACLTATLLILLGVCLFREQIASVILKRRLPIPQAQHLRQGVGEGVAAADVLGRKRVE